MTPQLLQYILSVFFFLAYAVITRKRTTVFIYLISFPFVFYFPLRLTVLISSLLFATFTYEFLVTRSKIYMYLSLATLLLTFLIVGKNTIFLSPTINIIDHQRGAHPNWENSLFAKALHNKIFLSYQFLDNLFDKISPTRILASGWYPNLSKYLPLGYLFPHDAILLFLSIKAFNKKLLHPFIIFSLLIVLTTVAVISSQLSYFALASFVFFLSLLVSHTIQTIPLKISLAIVILNALLLIFFNPAVNIFWNVGFRL